MNIYTWLNRIRKNHRDSRKGKKLFFTAAAVVVFLTTYMLILPAITQTTETYCGKEEHIHTDECNKMNRYLACSIPEDPGHVHTDACYSEVSDLICDIPEGISHKHTDACIGEECTLACGYEEGESDETGEPHVHTDECYDIDFVYTCGLEEGDGHVHTDICYVTERELTCTQTEGSGHRHTDECYIWLPGEVCCGKEEHVHNASCYSNHEADVETEDDWIRTMKGASLTGNWSENVAAIAKTQVGYQESTDNYIVDEMGTKNGYTRYGQWYGMPYEEWDAMFASFCIRYAGIDSDKMPVAEKCDVWLSKLGSLYHGKESYQPKTGDLVFFDQNEDHAADHVGVIVQVISDEKLEIIEGDNGHAVTKSNVSISNSCILGYGEIPQNPDEQITVETETETESETVTEIESEVITEAETESETEQFTEPETEIESEVITEAETESETEPETESESEWFTEPETEIESEIITESETESETEPETESESEWFTEPETESESVIITEAETESESEIITEAETESETEQFTEPETTSEVEIITEVETVTETETESETETETETESETETETETETESETETETETESETETETESETESETETESESETEELVLTFDGTDYHIKVTYTEEAKLPENVELQAEELTGDAFNEKCIEAKNLMNLEEITFARFFDITFMVDGKEVEPKAAVNVEIVYDEQLPVGECNTDVENIVHFKDDGAEILDMEIRQLDDGGTSILFEQESFSVTGSVLGVSARTVASLSLSNAPEVGTTIYAVQTDSLTAGEWYLIYGYASESGDYDPGLALVATNPTTLSDLAVGTDDSGGSVRYIGDQDVCWQWTSDGFVNRNGQYLSFINNNTWLAEVTLEDTTANAKVTYDGFYNILYNTVTIPGSSTKYQKLYLHNWEEVVQAIVEDGEGAVQQAAVPVYIARVLESDVPSGGHDNHPQGAVTGTPDSTKLKLYNIDASGGTPQGLAGVQYTVYDANGNIVKSVFSTESYEVVIGNLPDGNYTVKQTATPTGYVPNTQETAFSVIGGIGTIGTFYDFKVDEDGFVGEKTAQVVDYINRTYQIDLSAMSGAYKYNINSLDFTLVVDQSNSMLFPSELKKTGMTVTLSTDTEQNVASLNALTNFDKNRVYYIIANEKITSTVYAIWWDGSGWCYQDAAYFAKAQMHELGYTNNVLEADQYVDYVHSDQEFNQCQSTGYLVKNGGGGFEKALGGTLYNDVKNGSKTFDIYTGSTYNRLHDVQDAVAILATTLGTITTDSTLRLETFDRNVETCAEYSLNSTADIRTVIQRVNEITTMGGTRQDYALRHLIGGTTRNDNTGHMGTNHLTGKDPAKTYIMLITDGAPVVSSSDPAVTPADVLNAANEVKPYGTLITLGLSMKNVEGGSEMLRNAATSSEFSYEAEKAEDTAQAMVDLMLKIGERVGQTVQADVKDVISDSFYPINPDTNEPLSSGTRINLEGEVDADGAGTVLYDTDIGWYVLWDNQDLDVTYTPGSTKTEIITTYTTEIIYKTWNGDFGTAVDKGLVYFIDSGWWLIKNNGELIHELPGYQVTGNQGTNIGRLAYDKSTGKWSARWYKWNSNAGKYYYGNYDSDETSHFTEVQIPHYQEVTVVIPGTSERGLWHGRVYVKAKEDFIGGNSIDTNKEASVTLQDENGQDAAGMGYPLETPTVNVRLLPITGYCSEETIFLGDTQENITGKLQTLLEKSVFTKIVSGTGDVYNKVGANASQGCYADNFTVPYAIKELTAQDWETLRNGGTVRIPYTYDDDSSHGAVGNFVFSLRKTGSGEEVGECVEVYTLTVTYEALSLSQRRPNVHNGANGPGTEVGKGDTIPTGAGEETTYEIHYMHVVDGKILVTKKLDASLVNESEDQTFTFNLLKSDVDGIYRTANVTVLKGETEATVSFEHLPRGSYTVTESISSIDMDPAHADDYPYLIKGISVIEKIDGNVLDETNCRYEIAADQKSVTFIMGTRKDGSDAIQRYDQLTHVSSRWIMTQDVYSIYLENTTEDTVGQRYHKVTQGHAVIENTKAKYFAEIPVQKIWEDGEEHRGTDVYVVLYNKDGLVYLEDKVQILKLNTSNSWTDSYTVPIPYKYYDITQDGYYVREVTGGLVSDISKMEEELKNKFLPGIVVNDTGEPKTTGYVRVAQEGELVTINGVRYGVYYNNNGTTKIITNKTSYSLPETGGTGTNLYTTSGGCMITLALVIYIFLIKRRRERKTS